MNFLHAKIPNRDTHSFQDGGPKTEMLKEFALKSENGAVWIFLKQPKRCLLALIH